MSVVAAGCAAAALGGMWLAASGMLRLRPDPVTRALSGGAIPDPGRPESAVDRALREWDARVGRERRSASLAVLQRPGSVHRRRQVRMAVGLAAVAATFAWVVTGPTSSVLVWGLLALPVGLHLCDRRLHHEAAKVRDRLADQVIPLSEFLALCATAGLTAAESFDRSAVHLPHPMQGWVMRVAADVRSGRSLEQALLTAAEGIHVPEFRRLVDTVLTASGRGTPLAGTLVGQVADARDRNHARLLERAGRAEIAMLVPIVFLVLPSVVAVAVYPGFLSLVSI